MANSTTEYEYDAFISYSHSEDAGFSKVIHAGLQSFGTPFFKGRAMRIYLDDANISMTNDLWGDLQSELKASEFFLLLASPSSARSEWVVKEINEFLKNNSLDNIGVIVTSGKTPWTSEEYSQDDADVAVSKEIVELLTEGGREPLVIDLSQYREKSYRKQERQQWQNHLASIVSAITGQEKDKLYGLHMQRLRQRLFIFSGLAALFLLASILAVVFALDANRKTKITEKDNLRLSEGIKLKIAPTDRPLLIEEKWYRIATDYKLSVAILSSPSNKATGFLIEGSVFNPNWAAETILVSAGHVLMPNPSNFTAVFPGVDPNQNIKLGETIFSFSLDDLDVAGVRLEGKLPRGVVAISNVKLIGTNSHLNQPEQDLIRDLGPTSIGEILSSMSFGMDELSMVGWSADDDFFLSINRLVRTHPSPNKLTLEYTYTPSGGSSGAPIFDANTGELVCVHQRGGFGKNEQDNLIGIGTCTTISSIIKAIKG